MILIMNSFTNVCAKKNLQTKNLFHKRMLILFHQNSSSKILSQVKLAEVFS